MNNPFEGIATPDANPFEGIATPDEAPSKIESFGRAYLRNLPGVQQVTAASAPINPFTEKSNYSDELAYLNQRGDVAKQANPISYDAGAITGAITPAFIPGVNAAMTGDLMSAIGSNAAMTGAQALSDTNLTHPTGQDMKEAAKGAVEGGVFGGLGHAISAAMPMFRAGNDQELMDRAAQSASDIGMFSPKQLKELPIKYGKQLPANATPKDIELLLGHNLNTTLADAGVPIRPLDSAATVYQKASNALDTLGARQGQYIAQMTKDIPPNQQSSIFSQAVNNLEEDFKDKFANVLPKAGNETNRLLGTTNNEMEGQPLLQNRFSLGQRVLQQMDYDKSVNPTIAGLQGFKSKMGKMVADFSKTDDFEAKQVYKMGYDAANDAIKNVGGPQLKTLLNQESQLYDSIDALQTKMVNPARNGGLQSYYRSPLAIGAFGMGHLLGGWIPGLVAGLTTANMADKFGPTAGAAFYREGNQGLAQALPKMAAGARMALTNTLQKMFAKPQQ